MQSQSGVTLDVDTTESDEITSERRIRRLFWLLAVIFGFLQAWSSRMTLVNDTVSYLDMGDYVFHGRWAMAINGIWSPLYAILLGATLRIFKPSPYWQYPLVHLLLFVAFLCAMGSFQFFLRELIALRRETESGEELKVPVWVWMVIGNTLFLGSSLALIGVSETNPDMILAAFFYLTCGFLIRIERGVVTPFTCPALGLVLALGYLTKSVMFPIALVCFVAAWFAGRDRSNHTMRLLSAIAVFLLVAGPFIGALSVAKHKLTFGESGAYNYAVHVNKIDPHYWLGENPGNGVPVHPFRKLVDQPATFGYGDTMEGTYPNWFDPSFWYQGVKDRLDVHEQVRTIKTNLWKEISLCFALSGSVICGVFILFYTSAFKKISLEKFAGHWFLWGPSIVALGLYSLVWFEPRYVAPFMVVLGLCCFFSIHHRATAAGPTIFSAVAILIFVMFMSPFGEGTVPKNFSAIKSFRHPRAVARDSSFAVADAMRQMGLQPGDRISSLEFSNLDVAMWARLAGFKIASEVYYWPGRAQASDNDFWNADTATREKVLNALAATGSRAVVSHETPRGAAVGWIKVGETGYYLRWLAPITTQAVNQNHR